VPVVVSVTGWCGGELGTVARARFASSAAEDSVSLLARGCRRHRAIPPYPSFIAVADARGSGRTAYLQVCRCPYFPSLAWGLASAGGFSCLGSGSGSGAAASLPYWVVGSGSGSGAAAAAAAVARRQRQRLGKTCGDERGPMADSALFLTRWDGVLDVMGVMTAGFFQAVWIGGAGAGARPAWHCALRGDRARPRGCGIIKGDLWRARAFRGERRRRHASAEREGEAAPRVSAW
jgi:hypothetical protein